MYGICYDEAMKGNAFEYLIADKFNPAMRVPEGFVTKAISAHTWAVFPCKGDSAGRFIVRWTVLLVIY